MTILMLKYIVIYLITKIMQIKKVCKFKLMHASKEENFQQTKESVESAASW